ncbi:hypothetical protein BH10PSE11_BH10PSE11_08380 [soil metagenome]
MAKNPGYEIIAFERKPDLWRISITALVEHGPAAAQTRQSIRFFSEVDYPSEIVAREAAACIIRDLPVLPDVGVNLPATS